jgi:START domain.
MKRAFKIALFSGMLLLTSGVYAQRDGWKTEKTNDGKIVVRSKVSEWSGGGGNTLPLIEYVATTTDYMNLQNCMEVMKDVSKHSEFLDIRTNERIKTISETEWLNYYVFNAPWPFSPSDCVVRVRFSEDRNAKTVVFTFAAAPDMMKKTDMKRFNLYNFTYAFRDLGNNKVEVTVSSKMALTGYVPQWMLRASFPGSAANPLQKLINLIKKYK